jgi:ACS family glucarate transporter-like MFS transporter
MTNIQAHPSRTQSQFVLSPSAVRWRIMALVTAVNMLPSLGKISLGIAGKNIQDEFRFSDATMGWILSAFVVGYALFQFPGGWAADRYGPRKVLTFAILWYSVFLAAMAMAPKLPLSHWIGLAGTFAVIRFFVGAGEAFTSPNSAKVVGSWMSSGRLAFGISFYNLGIGAGGVLTPILIAWTMQHWGWRTSFWLCGLIGGFFAIVWSLYITDRPEQHPHVNSAELELLRPRTEPEDGRPARNIAKGRPPWRMILSSGLVRCLILSYMCRAYAMYFFDTWFFIYLIRSRGLTISRGGKWGATPYLAILLLSPIGGWFSDFAVRKFGKRRGRQTAVWVGMACSAMLVWIGCNTSNNTVAILLVACGAGFNMFANITWWATCIDLVPSYAASLSGLMNMCGALSGALAPILTAYISTRFGWPRALDFIAILSLIAGLLWFFVRADENLEQEPARILPNQYAGIPDPTRMA